MQIGAEIPIKAYDIDSMGIVSNIVYIRWFEDLRHLFLDRYYPYEKMMGEGISPMLMKTEAEYKQPLAIGDKPEGRLWVRNMGRFKWEMGFEIYSGEVVHCAGVQKGCFFDLKGKKIAPCPDSLIGEYEAARAVGEDALGGQK